MSTSDLVRRVRAKSSRSDLGRSAEISEFSRRTATFFCPPRDRPPASWPFEGSLLRTPALDGDLDRSDNADETVLVSQLRLPDLARSDFSLPCPVPRSRPPLPVLVVPRRWPGAAAPRRSDDRGCREERLTLRRGAPAPHFYQAQHEHGGNKTGHSYVFLTTTSVDRHLRFPARPKKATSRGREHVISTQVWRPSFS